jgi:SH3-like domain-containing protein
MFENRLDKKASCLYLPVLQAVIIFAALFTTTVYAASEQPGEEDFERPRFVSLSSDLVNMREGPSTVHSVKWIYHRDGLPVQVLAEYDVWRRVRDMDGEVGWIHVSLLSNERTGVVVGNGYAQLRAGQDVDASVIAQVAAGVVGRVETCGPISCRLDFSGIEGWVDRARIWGVYADEHF